MLWFQYFLESELESIDIVPDPISDPQWYQIHNWNQIHFQSQLHKWKWIHHLYSGVAPSSYCLAQPSSFAALFIWNTWLANLLFCLTEFKHENKSSIAWSRCLVTLIAKKTNIIYTNLCAGWLIHRENSRILNSEGWPVSGIFRHSVVGPHPPPPPHITFFCFEL